MPANYYVKYFCNTITRNFYTTIEKLRIPMSPIKINLFCKKTNTPLFFFNIYNTRKQYCYWPKIFVKFIHYYRVSNFDYTDEFSVINTTSLAWNHVVQFTQPTATHNYFRQTFQQKQLNAPQYIYISLSL